jgi:hypothetical protein
MSSCRGCSWSPNKLRKLQGFREAASILITDQGDLWATNTKRLHIEARDGQCLSCKTTISLVRQQQVGLLPGETRSGFPHFQRGFRRAHHVRLVCLAGWVASADPWAASIVGRQMWEETRLPVLEPGTFPSSSPWHKTRTALTG